LIFIKFACSTKNVPVAHVAAPYGRPTGSHRHRKNTAKCTICTRT